VHIQQRGFLNPIVRTADEPMFTVPGILLEFVSTPDQNGGNLSVMRGAEAFRGRRTLSILDGLTIRERDRRDTSWDELVGSQLGRRRL
jgi:hypothetical protein